MTKNINDDSLVIVPVFNESKNILKVLKKLSKYFSNILVIDDSSEDDTFTIIESSKLCLAVKHSINCGQGTSLSTGFKYFLKYTKCSYLITFDGDGQHKVEDCLKMLSFARKNNCKAIFASRFLGKKKTKLTKLRSIFLKMAVLFEKLFFKINLSDAHNGLRVLNRESCEKLINLNCSYMAHATEIPSKLIKSGIEIFEHPCEINYALTKESNNLLDSLNIISDLLQRK